MHNKHFGNIYFGLALLLILVFSSAVEAARYRIRANILPQEYGICFIKGVVTDDTGKPVYPGTVSFDCGTTRTQVPTLPAGVYINNAPECSDYTITASAPGKKSVSFSNKNVGIGELLPLDFAFGPDSSLADTILLLKLLNGETVALPLPADHDLNNQLGLPDVIFNLQDLAGMRIDGQSSLAVSVRRVMSSSNACKKAKVGKDTDGDDIDDWFQEVDVDEDGLFEIADLEEGEYSISAFSADNGQGVRVQNIKVAGRNVHLKTLRMKEVGGISGQVTLGDGAPPDLVDIDIPGIASAVKTDATGTFTISNLPEGTYTLRAIKAGYGTVLLPGIAVDSKNTSTVDTINLPAVVGNLGGTFTRQNSPDHRGTLISLRAPDGSAHVTVTDVAGAFNYIDLPEGQYTLTATHPGHTSHAQVAQIVPGTPVVVGPQELAEVQTRGTLSGTVTLQGLTEHIGTLVSVAGTPYQAVTDAGGNFSIPDIPAGNYTVFMNMEGYVPQKVDLVEITTGGEETLATTLVPSTASEQTVKTGTIAGTIRFHDGSTDTGIDVVIEETGAPATTTSTGAFFLENVEAGTYTLSIGYAGFKTVFINGVTVVPWDTAFIDPVSLKPKVGTISGTVVLEDGTAPSGVLVSVDGTSVQAVTGGDGSFILSPLLAGDYTVRFHKDNYVDVVLEGADSVLVTVGQDNPLAGVIELNQPPEAPFGVMAAYESNTAVKVGWSASPSVDVIGYDVYYGNAQDHTDVKANATPVSEMTGGLWEYTVTGLTAGTEYWFTVLAVDNDQLTSPLAASFKPTAGGSIAGTVTLSGLSVHTGVSITVDGESYAVSSAADGAFVIDLIPAGTYTIRFSRNGYVEDTVPNVEVIAGQTTNITTPIVLLKETGAIEGKAYLEGATFNQHGDVTISLTGTTINTVTDAYGDFALSPVPTGSYTVRAAKEGYFADEIEGFQVLPGQTNDLPRPLVLKKPPEPCTGVSVIQTTGSSATVSCTKSVSSDLDTGGYNFYYGTSSDAITTKANASLVAHPATSDPVTFEVTGLEKGVTYYFAVEAVDNDGLTSDSVPADGSVKLAIVPSFEGYVPGNSNYLYQWPYDIILSEDGTKGYVSLRASPRCVFVLDLAATQPAVIGQINLAVGSQTSPEPVSLAYNASKGHLYAVDTNINRLFVIDTSTDSVIQEVTVGNNPTNVIASPDGLTAYVCSNDDKVTVVDTTTYTTETIELTGFGDTDPDPYGMAIANNTLYVVGSWSDKIFRIDVDRQSSTFHSVLLPLISVGSGGSAYDAVASEDGSYVYVSHTDTNEGNISIISTSDNILLSPIEIGIGKTPKGMAVAGNILYIANNEDNTLSMVNTSTNTQLETETSLSTHESGPEHIAISPNGSKLYIVCSQNHTVVILSY